MTLKLEPKTVFINQTRTVVTIQQHSGTLPAPVTRNSVHIMIMTYLTMLVLTQLAGKKLGFPM